MSNDVGPGATFGGYRIDRRLGGGGMGVVYAATDTQLGRRVALKVMSAHHAGDPAFRERFLREATALARLDSAHVTAVFDHGEHDGQLYIATQYVAGGDLGTLLDRRGPLPLHLAAAVAAQMADALQTVHAVDIVHRDVKPSNVLLRDPDESPLHAYLCDFGVAHTGAEVEATVAGAVAGSWPYLAPERVRGEPGGPASDLYSLGCLLWTALTGQPPYTGTDVEVAVAHLQDPTPQFTGRSDTTAQVNAVLARALAKDPRDRYADAATMASDLHALAVLRDSSSTPLRQVPKPSRRTRGRRRTLVLVTAAAVVAVVGAGASRYLLGEEPPAAPGTTWTSTSEAASPPPAPAVRFDFDGDGLSDIHTVVGNASTPSLLSSTGEEFTLTGTNTSSYVSPWAITGDVDGDGTSELISKGGRSAGGPLLVEVTFADRYREFRVSLGPGAGATDDIEGEPSAMSVADFDGDGREDLAFGIPTTKGIEVRVARSRPNGFAPAKTWLVLGSGTLETRPFRPGDFDGDGQVDLLVLATDEYSNPPTKMWTYRSTGKKFSGRRSVPMPPDPIGDVLVLPADLNDDGCDDLVRLEHTLEGEQPQVWRSDCQGFSPVENWGSALEHDPSQVAVGDFDGDGREDLALLELNENATPVRMLRSTGRSFSRPKLWLKGPSFTRVLGDSSTRYWE